MQILICHIHKKHLVERGASGWHFWGVVVPVAFCGPYRAETGYDPRGNVRGSADMRIETGHKEEAKVVDRKRGANHCKRGAYIYYLPENMHTYSKK